AGTYSIKLTKKDYIQEKKLSFLGIDKNKTWKLYEVSKSDRSLARAKFAADLWNTMNAGTVLVRRYEFVEVIENNVYKGLYLLAPKWSRSMLSLSDEERVVSREALTCEETQTVFALVSDRSLSRYYLFLQAAYAYKNCTEDYVVIEKVQGNGEKGCLLAPDKLKHAFGGFEKRLHYLTWVGDGHSNDTSRMLIAFEDIEAAKGRQETELLRYSAEDWRQLRVTALGDEPIHSQLALYKRYFIESGLAVRCVDDDAFGYYYGLFEEYVTDRLAFMDEFFEYSGGAAS
ncbi:MAG: CotH kinase family protein, partial [Lachnospiraceae bacterium]|nr:CotH kinase family protein [Lachnospiraceae bacterium]